MSADGVSSALRDRYLDLVTSVLINSIYEDAAMDPWGDRTYDEALRAVGRDWPSVAHTMVGRARLANLRELVEKTLHDGVPGNYIETGVWRGGCCILIKAVLAAYGVRRKVIVADSFAGLPPPKAGVAADADDQHHTFEALAVSLDEVKSNFRKYDLLDEDVVFVQGFFEATLPTLETGPLALLRLDGDMYDSTMVAIEALYPKLSSGGFVVADDYGAVAGCRQAIDEYRRVKGIETPMNKVDWTGVWWRKP